MWDSVAKYQKNYGYQRELVSMVYKSFNKMSSNKQKGTGINSDVISENTQIVEKSYKPIIRKFEKRNVYSYFIDNIWGADLADMQLISKFNKGFLYL